MDLYVGTVLTYNVLWLNYFYFYTFPVLNSDYRLLNTHRKH